MAEKKLSTDPYKGVRDFYPEDMAVQQYIFDTWSYTAELFGYERYDASVLEPAALYKAKGAENEELVSEQTYTFTDRGDREVTLRPEMTPTVARMIAGKRRELSFPVRWYSIPNLFRYERAQRGRLREHWQLNCDIFLTTQAGGADDISADVEIIALAHRLLLNFGATEDMFEIRINNRAWLNAHLAEQDINGDAATEMIALLDRKEKIDNFAEEAEKIAGKPFILPDNTPDNSDIATVIDGLKELGITNVRFSPSTVRGFNYYTGTVFEFFDTSEENRRALLGGGRYDNLTELFGGDKISGIGFGMGDVTMRDFLETHNLLTADSTAPDVVVIPMEDSLNLEAQKIAQAFREAEIATTVDIGTKKLGKKIATAGERMVNYALILGEDELKSGIYTLKNLQTEEEQSGTLDELIQSLE